MYACMHAHHAEKLSHACTLVRAQRVCLAGVCLAGGMFDRGVFGGVCLAGVVGDGNSLLIEAVEVVCDDEHRVDPQT